MWPGPPSLLKPNVSLCFLFGVPLMRAVQRQAPAVYPSGELVFEPPSGPKRLATSLALLRALPWRRFKKDSVLVIELDGAVSEKRQGR